MSKHKPQPQQQQKNEKRQEQKNEKRHKKRYLNILARSLCIIGAIWFFASFVAFFYSYTHKEIDFENIPLVIGLSASSVVPVLSLIWMSYRVSQKKLVLRSTIRSKRV